jgi:protein arginine kinase activator
MQKVDLCEECASNKGVNDPATFSLADLLLGLGAAQEVEQSGGSDLRCPKCGFTQGDFKKAGRLGCADCYATFADGLEGLLKTMHKGTKHAGKVPHSLQQTRDMAERFKVLQKKLSKAVEDENFEQAATLRDEIRQLSQKLGNVPTT